MSASITRPSLTGAYVRRRVRRDGTVRVAGLLWQPFDGRQLTPRTWLEFAYRGGGLAGSPQLEHIGLDDSIPRRWVLAGIAR